LYLTVNWGGAQNISFSAQAGNPRIPGQFGLPFKVREWVERGDLVGREAPRLSCVGAVNRVPPDAQVIRARSEMDRAHEFRRSVESFCW
jgi:hypothetical protein